MSAKPKQKLMITIYDIKILLKKSSIIVVTSYEILGGVFRTQPNIYHEPFSQK